MPNSAISIFCFLLLGFSIEAHAIEESFSVHLVHPDNDAIVSSLKNDFDLTEYMKIVLTEDGKDIALWAKKKAAIDIGDIDRASLEFPSLGPLTPSVRSQSVDSWDPKPFPQVRIWLSPKGSKKFADFTRRNIKKRAVVILDRIAIAAPLIFEPITDGRFVITGDFLESRGRQIVDRINKLLKRNKSM
jgi:hypothetical protein